jgi:hypothetical protein
MLSRTISRRRIWMTATGSNDSDDFIFTITDLRDDNGSRYDSYSEIAGTMTTKRPPVVLPIHRYCFERRTQVAWQGIWDSV